MKFELAKVTWLSISAAAWFACANGTSNAAEPYTFARPIGVFDIFAAELPQEPGLYGLALQNFGTYDSTNGRDGNSVFSDTSGRRYIAAFGPLYIFPEQVMGGRMATSLVLGYGRNQLTVTKTIPGLSADNWGLYDATADLFWQKSFYDFSGRKNVKGEYSGPPPGFSFGGGLSVNIPIGAFDDAVVGNTGKNSWVLAPNVAVTYRTHPIFLDGTEFSGRLFYNYVSERIKNDYTDGDYINLDWAITERYNRFQFGLAGALGWQIDDDKGPGVGPGGQRTSAVMLGALLSVDLPELGSRVTVKYLESVSGEYSTGGKTLSAKWIVKF